MCKLYNQPIDIKKRSGQTFFTWRNRDYYIQKTLRKWNQKDHWWNPKQAVDRIYAVVQANSRHGTGVFELYYCKISKQYYLHKVLD